MYIVQFYCLCVLRDMEIEMSYKSVMHSEAEPNRKMAKGQQSGR